jgi:hypothetical protein
MRHLASTNIACYANNWGEGMEGLGRVADLDPHLFELLDRDPDQERQR